MPEEQNSNTGYYNVGEHNAGNHNAGDYNAGDYNVGYFCEETPSPIFFDLPSTLSREAAARIIPYIDLPVGCEWVPESEMSYAERTENENHKAIGGFLRTIELTYHEAWQKLWPTLNGATKQRFLDLPNFDAEKFMRITGVDVRVADGPAIPQSVVVDGRTYVLEEGAAEKP